MFRQALATVLIGGIAIASLAFACAEFAGDSGTNAADATDRP